MRDELGITETMTARPIQAAFASAASFASGAIVPVLAVLFVSGRALVAAVMAISLVLLAATGALGARAGGANPLRGAARVVFWGLLAMAVTAGIGQLFGTRP